MYAKATCNTCGKQFILGFGDMPKADAIQRFEEMEKQGIYCPIHRKENISQKSVAQFETEEVKSPTDQ